MKKIGIINYGVGNVLSIQRAILLSGHEAYPVSNISDLKYLSGLILPGVGHFSAAALSLRKTGLDAELRKLLGSNIKVLGICLGMHLMTEQSEEAENVMGLGIFNAKTTKNKLSKVNTGWREVYMKEGSSIGRYYFNHGYSVEISCNQKILTKLNIEDDPIPAIIERENFCGVQFHPEKSQASGVEFLKGFFR